MSAIHLASLAGAALVVIMALILTAILRKWEKPWHRVAAGRIRYPT